MTECVLGINCPSTYSLEEAIQEALSFARVGQRLVVLRYRDTLVNVLPDDEMIGVITRYHTKTKEDKEWMEMCVATRH